MAEPIKMPFGAVNSCRVSTTPGNHGNLEFEIALGNTGNILVFS